MNFTRRDIDVANVRAMAWVGDSLINVAGGWRGLMPDRRQSWMVYGDSFDTAVCSPAGDVIVLAEGVGTKGLVLDETGHVVREINRSYYEAEAYRYPVALFTLPDGRTGLVHCPEQYNQLEIEVALTGERLTASTNRAPADIFHSRLGVSADGSLLASAGWLWHPWGSVHVYDITRALADPRVLDNTGDCFSLRGLTQAEVAGACFVGRDMIISTTSEENEPEDADDLGPNMLARRSMDSECYLWRIDLPQTAGDLVTFANGVLALNGHPRLYDAEDGELIAEWPDLNTGDSSSAITWSNTFRGPGRVAVAPSGERFAFTDGKRVVMIKVKEN